MYFYFFPPIFLFNFTPPVLLPSIFQFIQQFVQSVSSIHMKLQKELVSEKMSIPFLSLSRKSIKINCRSIKKHVSILGTQVSIIKNTLGRFKIIIKDVV